MRAHITQSVWWQSMQLSMPAQFTAQPCACSCGAACFLACVTPKAMLTSLAGGSLLNADSLCCRAQVKCALLLKWHSDWSAATHTLTQQSATWLYALTARLERPLTQVRFPSW